MQKLCKFEALHRLEIQCYCHKDSPYKRQFIEEIFASILEKFCFKIPRIFNPDIKMLLAFLQKILSMLP